MSGGGGGLEPPTSAVIRNPRVLAEAGNSTLANPRVPAHAGFEPAVVGRSSRNANQITVVGQGINLSSPDTPVPRRRR